MYRGMPVVVGGSVFVRSTVAGEEGFWFIEREHDPYGGKLAPAGGRVKVEKGEPPDQGAARESAHEIGFRPLELRPMGMVTHVHDGTIIEDHAFEASVDENYPWNSDRPLTFVPDSRLGEADLAEPAREMLRNNGYPV